MSAGERVAPAAFRTRLALLGTIALLAGACTPTTNLDDARATGRARVGVTQGSAVAVTQDERVAVVTNRSDGVVSIVSLDPSKDAAGVVNDKSHVDIPFLPLNESKPWAAVIGKDDDTAYVLLRGSAEVVRVSGLHGRNPHVSARVDVGSEPTAIVISPSGKSLFVANWGEGTVSSILTATMAEAPLDLNRRLSDEMFLGQLVGNGERASAVWTNIQLDLGQRKGLAHPRALAMTDNGDAVDTDETLYVTEFFAQPLSGGGPGGPDDLDHSRIGVVYPILLETNGAPPERNVITLQPVDISFKDGGNEATGCFPNQLYSAAVSADRLYVTSVCASPKGPVDPGPAERVANNFKTLLHSAVFVVDTVNNVEVPSERLVLTETLDANYRSDLEVTVSDQRMPLIPTEIVVGAPDASGQRQAYLSAMGSSAVYPIAFAANGTSSVGSEGHRFIDLRRAMPGGLAVLSKGRALLFDDLKPGLRLLDLTSERQVAAVDTLSHDWAHDESIPQAERLSDDARDGRRLFSTGLTAWSFQGQAWSSCESCHPDGLSDGVTWRFARGPRRTLSLAGTYFRDEPTRRVLLWGANVDELHDVEGIARSVSGGVGGVVWNPYAGVPGQDCRLLYDGKAPTPDNKTPECPAPLSTTFRANGLNGSLGLLSPHDKTHCEPSETPCDLNSSRDWEKIDAFTRAVRAPRAPRGIDATRVSKGAALFVEMRCNACHAGPGWTLSQMFYEPGLAANGKIPYADPRQSSPATTVDQASIDEMLGFLRTGRYKVPNSAPRAFGLAGELVAYRTAPRADEDPLDYVFGQLPVAAGMTAPPALPVDRINCVLRNVGTFPDSAFGTAGVVPVDADVPPISEVRRVLVGTAYQDKLAFGDTGFNTPPLVGLATGAPYFHAGNARTLEELFDPTFAGHHGAMGAAAPSSEDIRNLVSYLLSLDETGTSALVDPDSSELDLCAQLNP